MAPIRNYLLPVMEPVCNLFCGCFTNFADTPLIDEAHAHADHLQQVSPPATTMQPTTEEQYEVAASPDNGLQQLVEVQAPPLIAPERPVNYHVFISHRGPEVKRVLVDFLHLLLIQRGFTCFVDEHALETGEKSWSSILSAIHCSEVQIIVLSKSFAESTFCLNEVHEIMQSHSNKVLPVFYDVEPSALRSTNSGPYDLSQYAAHDRSRWATALQQLSCIVGFRLDQTNGFEGVLAKRIVSRVAELLSNPAPFYVDPIFADRLCSRADQAEKHLDLDLSAAREGLPVVSLGIVGLANVGKSTIAKLLFNKLHNQFQASSILLDVREKAKSPGGLIELQARLLKDLLKEDWRIFDLDEGLGLLLERLKNVKCLIVIDDIDIEFQQLKNLLVLDKNHLGRGSRLVFTTRYEQVLHWAPVDVKTLTLTSSEEEAKTLAISYISMDVYQGFIDHLEESFSMLGLSVSVQRLSILNGGLERQTKLLLVVLSKSFITSPQLLNELSELSNSDATIVPVFYSLEPHAVESLWKTMQAVSTGSSEIGESSSMNIRSREKWKQMMSNKAVHLSVELDKPAPFDRRTFKSLINGVVELLQHKYPQVNVAEYPVGLKERQQQVERLISNISGSKEKYVGVVGMGGVGKTTLVKSLYNNIHKKFEGSALLLNVRAEAGQHGLQHLQKAMLDKVLGYGENIQSVDDGKLLLSRRLAGTNTLIILDDVDNESQVEALLAPLNLGPGSRVIITSRNREILKAGKVEEMYEVQLLSRSDAKMLFWWHAFLRPYPPAELQDLAQDVIDACQGLPLSLKVIGAHVYDHTEAKYFRDTLVHLKKADNDIFRQLRISVDALKARDEKKAFLDVACFFIGKRVETALSVWEGCGWAARCILEILKSKCLVNVDATNGTIGMHDQIRDMGRYIVVEDPLNADIKPLHTRTHVWDQEDARKILQESRRDQGSNMYHIRGLSWISQELKQCNADAFLGLSSHLEILLLAKVSIGGDFCRLRCNEIRWLEWHHCNLDVLPPGLCSRELTVLDLSESQCLKAIWRRPDEDSDSEDIEVPRGLLELNLSGCKILQELPTFDPYLLRLQQLNLSRCSEMRELHRSIRCLTSLEVLDLSGCESLSFLPDEIEGLTSLKKLLLSGCKSLQSLPRRIGQLWNLTEIYLDHTKLTELPDSFGELERLERLDLSNCLELVSLPPSIEGLKALKVCYMSNCPKLKELPHGFCKLVMLSELKLANCSQLQSLPANIGNLTNLEHLWLQKNSRLTNLPPSTGKLCSLKTLNVGFCSLTNEGIPDELGKLERLGELYMEHTAGLCKVPASFADLGGVSRLHMHHCIQLREAAHFPSKLSVLRLGYCPHLQIISGLHLLKELENLDLCDCPELRELKGLEGLESLQNLNISGCSSLRHAPGLYAISSLKRLHLNGSRVIPPWNLLEMPSIEHTTVFGSEMPKCFRNCMNGEIDGLEHANQEVMTLQIPAMDSTSRPSCFAIVLCLVSHDQGWSDSSDDYGSYIESPTFVEGVLVRNRSRVEVDLLYRNRHADCRDQVHVVVLRQLCPLLKSAKGGDTIEIRARSLYQAWRITVKQASYLVVNGDSEHLTAVLQMISAELRWAALSSAALESLVQSGRNESLRALAVLDIAGNSELTRVLPISSTERNDIQVEKLDLVWRPNLHIHGARVRTLSAWWPFSLFGRATSDLIMNVFHIDHVHALPVSYLGKMMYLVGMMGDDMHALLIGPDAQVDIVFKFPIGAVSHLQVMTKKGTVHNPAAISHNLGLDLRLVSRSEGRLFHTQLYTHRLVKTSADKYTWPCNVDPDTCHQLDLDLQAAQRWSLQLANWFLDPATRRLQYLTRAWGWRHHTLFGRWVLCNLENGENQLIWVSPH